MYDNYAVYVKDVVKSYGSKEVLKQLNMTVERGTIYGLLGASGCGKTTLLSSIVGRKKFDSGEIYVLGGKAGEPGSGVPGPRVGYMPQDIALVGEFTIKDAIYYFGRIFNMEEDLISQRYCILHSLLELPPDDRYLKNCSGGQQRRVSFAASVIHKPELLIMDEPTVGVDPVLRDRLWNYLVELTEKENTSVIITTHYIEEARQSHKIGLMREGRLLAEESPARLLSIFHTDTLEEVFLILSRRQEEGQLQALNAVVTDDQNNTVMDRTESTTSVSTVATFDIGHGSTDILTTKKTRVKGSKNFNKHRLRALMDKNWKQFYRNVTGLIFLLTFPIIEIYLFVTAVGGHIKDVPLAIVNDETMTASCPNFSPLGTAFHDNSSNACHFQNMSCRFLEELNNPMINKPILGVPYSMGVSAMKELLIREFKNSWHVTPGLRLQGCNSIGCLGKANKCLLDRQIGATIKYKLVDLYINFQKSVLADCQFLPQMGDIPVDIDFIYGEKDDSFTIYMTPVAS
ncbi:hypothetical protein NQ317_014263 [Molorchus minor]|uniref:ABC transporter domain-containing protein n=1 Tax=Molorchus minor TaxID=1323400 RepID=A0ABQ9IR61_9CUCU|nr:hypothetical protein NQ317_014263 [Molorchus minor]